MNDFDSLYNEYSFNSQVNIIGLGDYNSLDNIVGSRNYNSLDIDGLIDYNSLDIDGLIEYVHREYSFNQMEGFIDVENNEKGDLIDVENKKDGGDEEIKLYDKKNIIKMVYNREERNEKIIRWRCKKNRVIQHRHRYLCRSLYAKSRIRIGGRFVKKNIGVC